MGLFDILKKKNVIKGKTKNTIATPHIENRTRSEVKVTHSRKDKVCKNSNELHIFWNTNCKTLMSRQQYQEILKSFYRVYNEKYLIKDKSPIWTETEDTLSLSDSWSYYAYHDGTLSECFKISIQRENAIEPIWDSKKDWPCEKQQLLFHKTYGDDVREGWVSYSMHTALLLLNPFKLSGVWRLDIELSRNRYWY